MLHTNLLTTIPMSCCDECEQESNILTRVSGIRVAGLERSNPLPPGRYWIDIIDVPNQIAFNAWAFDNRPTVNVLKTEHFQALEWPDCPITEGQCWPSRDWVLFDVTSNTRWLPTVFGFPNHADETVQSSSDTADVPEDPDFCDIGCQAGKVALAGGVLLGGLALVFLIKH